MLSNLKKITYIDLKIYHFDIIFQIITLVFLFIVYTSCGLLTINAIVRNL